MKNKIKINFFEIDSFNSGLRCDKIEISKLTHVEKIVIIEVLIGEKLLIFHSIWTHVIYTQK